MNIPKAAGPEALVLVLSETKALKAKAKERERRKVKEKAEAHPENKVAVASGAAKVLAVEKAPALTNMIPTSALVRLKEKEKGKAKREKEIHRPLALVEDQIHQTVTLRRNIVSAFNMKKAPAQKVHPNVRMHILQHVNSFLKVNAETENTAETHTLSPSTPMQGPTLVTTPVELETSARGNLLAKQSQRQKGKVKTHALQRLFSVQFWHRK
jgi:hypothetical protein